MIVIGVHTVKLTQMGVYYNIIVIGVHHCQNTYEEQT